MKSVLIATLTASAMSAAVGARPVSFSRIDRVLTADIQLGGTYLAARELGVDVEFPDGVTGKGKLAILYEPASGLFFQIFNWERADYPQASLVAAVNAGQRVVVTADRIIVVGFASGPAVADSQEKASSLDEAERMAMKWISDHLKDIEIGTVRSSFVHLPVDRGEFPAGFVREFDAGGVIRTKLVGIERRGARSLDLTIESLDTHRRAKLLVSHTGKTWSRGVVRPDEKQEQK